MGTSPAPSLGLNMESPFSGGAVVVDDFDYRQAHIRVLKCQPSGFMALVEEGHEAKVLLNPIRGDRFRHRWTARKFAKSYVRRHIPKGARI